MTRDDFHFIVPEVCGRAKTPLELLDALNGMIISGYNVGEEWSRRINEYIMYVQKEDVLWKEFIPVPGILVEYDNASFHDSEIINIISELKLISSSLNKETRLLSWINSSTQYMIELFLKFIHLTFCNVFTFDATIKIFDSLKDQGTGNYLNLETILTKLEEIGFDNETKPKEKVKAIQEIYINSSPDSKKIIEFIISRKLDIKMNEKTFYDILSDRGPVEEFGKRLLIVPYQRCEKEDKVDRITTPFIGQLKADGKFQNVIWDHERELGMTLNRSGMRSHLNPFRHFSQFEEETKYFSTYWPKINFLLMGEALVKKPGTKVLGVSTLDIDVYDRKTSNGLLGSYGNRFITFKNAFDDCMNSLGTGRISKKLEKLISQLLEWKYVEDNTIYQLWNMVPYNNWLKLNTEFSCETSFNYINHFLYSYNNWLATKGQDTNLVLIHSEIFDSIDSAYDLYYRVLAKGMEGLIFKNLSAIIEHGVCTEGIIKLKDFKDCDLRVIGYNPGTGKYIGGIGSLICITECGRMTTDVSGLTDKQRGFIRVDPNDSAAGLRLDPEHNNDKFNNAIITVKYNALSNDKSGIPALSLASFMEVRTDVTKAQFLHEIKK